MYSSISFKIRSATRKDRKSLSELMDTEAFVHRHLDWKPALEWIGTPPFKVAERNGSIIGALSCSPDVPEIAWIRLFLARTGFDLQVIWKQLWESSKIALKEIGQIEAVTAIPLHNWFQHILIQSQFHLVNHVVMLNWDGIIHELWRKERTSVLIRPMLMQDIADVKVIDNEAFEPIWRISEEMLRIAFNQAAYATVAVLNNELVAYQITTYSSSGAHIARLATKPNAQRKGIGLQLVHDIVKNFVNNSIYRISVNTQSDNHHALSIYRKVGFVDTGEKYPVYIYHLD